MPYRIATNLSFETAKSGVENEEKGYFVAELVRRIIDKQPKRGQKQKE